MAMRGGQEKVWHNDQHKWKDMPAVMGQIDRMTTEEKSKTTDYIWSSLSVSDDAKFPAWHERELKATEGGRYFCKHESHGTTLQASGCAVQLLRDSVDISCP